MVRFKSKTYTHSILFETHIWYKNGLKHRDDHPAFIKLEDVGRQMWFQDGIPTKFIFSYDGDEQ